MWKTYFKILLIPGLALVALLSIQACSDSLVLNEPVTESTVSEEEVFTAPLSKKPIEGKLLTQFNLDYWSNPDLPNYYGTVTLDGTVYALVWHAIDSGKPFDERIRGQAYFFSETWAIYEYEPGMLIYDPVNQVLDVGDLVMWGYDRGNTVVSSSSTWAGKSSGSIEEAFEDMSAWAGRKVQFKMLLTFFDDGNITAAGTMRLH